MSDRLLFRLLREQSRSIYILAFVAAYGLYKTCELERRIEKLEKEGKE